jgi:choline transporter-like protein 2/4/5
MERRNTLANKEYKGEDYAAHKDLEKGPMRDRKCTDVICYGIFGLFVASMIGISVYGYVKGAPYKLVAPLDYDGNFCGYSKGFEEYKYLYISDISVDISDVTQLDELLDSTLCVKQCPKY